MWHDLLARTVFSVGDRSYQWVDVVLDAMRGGEWAAFERLLVEGIACEARAAAEDAWPDEGDVERAGNEFRYERDLLAAADVTAWLAGAGLTLDEWYGYLQRHVMRTAWREQAGANVDAYAPSVANLLDAAPADGLCSGLLMRLATGLSGRAAVVTRADMTPSAPPGDVASDEPTPNPIEGVDPDWFPSWPAQDLRARGAHLREIAAAFDACVGDALTSPALSACLRDHHIDWTRMEIEWMSCADQATAREALLCVREDGMSLAEVAVTSRCTLERGSFLLEDIPDDRRGLLLSARPGDVLGPLPNGSRCDLLTVVSKRAATLDDPDARTRARASVVAAVVAAAGSLVRWQAGGR